LVLRENQQKRLQHHDCLTEARIQIKVGGFHDSPIRLRVFGGARGKILDGQAKIFGQVSNHFLKRANFVKKLRTLR